MREAAAQPGTATLASVLPAVVDLATTAAVLRIGRTSAYELVRTGSWLTPVLRLGHRIRISTRPLLQLVGVEPEDPTPDPAGDPQAGPDLSSVHRSDSNAPRPRCRLAVAHESPRTTQI